MATIGIAFLTQVGAKWLFGIDLPEQDQLLVVLRNAGWNLTFLKLLVMILVVAPVSEEIIFRLCLFRLPALAAGVFTKSVIPVAVIAVIGSAVFSTAHYPDWVAIQRTKAWAWLPLSNAFIALFFFGLAQCWLYRKTKALWCPVLNHLLFNLTNLVIALLFLDK